MPPRLGQATYRRLRRLRADVTRRGWDAWVIAPLAALAFVRVFAFTSAFPFFNGIDEHRHADRVLKYARGFWPGPEEPKIEPQLALLMAQWGSPEFATPPERFANGIPAPVAPEQMSEPQRAAYREKVGYYGAFVSVDAHQPPVYPLLAAAGYRLGQALGFEGIGALYFVRWENAVAMAVLVVACWAFLRSSHAADPLVRLGAPLLIAAYPNDFQYGLTDDAIMPLLGGLSFGLLVRATAQTPLRARAAAAAGLAFALTLLDKYTAAGILAVAAGFAAVGIHRAWRSGWLRAEASAWLAFALTLALPVGAWVARNIAVLGDASGMRSKNVRMGIESVPVSEWLAHPLFGPRGWLEFLPGVVRSFWRGEFYWYGRPMSLPWLDGLYVATTALSLSLAAASWWQARRAAEPRCVEGAALGTVAAGVAMLATMSVTHRLRWGNFMTDWEAAPFFFSGRYVAWALMPFAIAFVRGVEVACAPLPRRLRLVAAWAALATLLSISMAGEIALSARVFTSPWNWYHLRGRRTCWDEPLRNDQSTPRVFSGSGTRGG